MPNILGTPGRGYRFDDAILAIPGRSQSYKDLIDSNTNFVPALVRVNSSSDQAEEALGIATITGFLVGENDTFTKQYYLYTKTNDGLPFAVIYSNGTTARGITVMDVK